MGVSNAWGKTVNGPRIYFDNSSMNMTSTQVYFVVGHNSFSRTYGPMTEISDTKLLYRDISKETYYNWGDATYVGFVQVGSKWGDGSWGSSNLTNATNYTAANTSWNSFDWQNTYYCKATSKGGALSIDYKSAGYSGIPKYNATQAAKLRNDISSSYATVKGTWPTTLKLQGTYLNGDGASARSEISGTASTNAENNRVYGAVVTGKITHTYNTISGDYIFEGWGTGSTPSTTNDSYEYNITANTTVYAFFTKAYTVTYGKKGESGSSTVSATATANSTTKNISSGTKVAAGSTIKLTATPASGYRVVGWYSDANCTNQLQNGGNTYNAGTLTAAKTVYVKFEETKYDVTIQAGANGSVSPSGVQKVGNITALEIAATADDECEFVNWTKTGNITITNANNSATTIKATGTGTVTANFRKIEYTTVYLKPGKWSSDDARFAVYAYVDNDNYDWYDMIPVGCSNEYYQCNISKKYTKVIFCRMNPSKPANNWDNKWNQSSDLSVSANKIWTFTGWDSNTDSKDEGTWTAYNPTVTLTLKSSSNGTYNITYKGKTYESSLTEDVVINDLPLNAEIIISDNANARPGYTFKKCLIKLGTNEQEDATLKTTYALCGTTTITADFVTEGPHTVYFKPNSNWTANSAWFAVYVYDEVGNNKWYKLTSQGNGYYSCDIEKGWSKLIFVRMKSGNATLSWTNKNAYQTFSHPIPVNRFSTYVLRDGKVGEDADEGYWTSAPTLSGAYRLRYVEQLVEHDATETWKVEINETKASHTPDDIIRKRANGRDTISLFINVNGDNPEVILQQYDGSEWVDIEAHMVNGPLETDASKAMLPGRHNASPESDIDDFVYDNGIDAITESGVWNFVIVQDADGKASLLLKEDGNDVTHKYTGNYYIRTNNATGGWNEYTHPDNIMKPSTNPESGYSHYYCKWVDIQNSNIATPENVKFIVATDYSINVSKEFAKDDYTATGGVLVENANVRWSWDENTGTVARAYIQGAYDGQNQNANIVLDYTTDGTTDAADVILFDTGDWIYTKDVTVNSGATLVKLIAQYPSKTISEVSPQTQNFIKGPITILTGMSGENYTVRVTYDFKNNKATTFLLPGTTDVATAVDVMIERVNQDKTTAVQSTIKATENHQFTVCGVMSFTKTHLTNNALHNDLRQFYWISFPFDVNLEDVYGFGVYGKHWILETYNGERRAQDGLWLDSPSFWEYILDPKGVTLEANKGYLLCLDSELLSGTSDVFTNTNKVSLYFPATTPTTRINTDYTTEVQIPSHVREEKRANRHIYDSNWNLIGVPSYANHTQTTNTVNLQYFYDYQYDNQTSKMIYAPKSTTNSTNEFQSMYAYFVQWGGTLNWSTFTGENNTPKELAAKQNAAYEAQEHNLRLELQKDYKALDQTFVDMQEDGVTAAFDLNKDMTKILNAGANIYTLAGEENIQLAGNSLPIANTTIPVGVQIAKAGEYTFAMPDGTDGITVELIDYETNTTTNLLLSEYNVSLPAGTFENRFALIVKPNKVATDMETIDDETNGVKKYIIDGKLFLQKDGMLYDAQGHIVR